jgi:hypothetical protein
VLFGARYFGCCGGRCVPAVINIRVACIAHQMGERNLVVTSEGIEYDSPISGAWIQIPSVEIIGEKNLGITIRAKSDGPNRGTLSYGLTTSPANTATFTLVPDGEWHNYEFVIPPQPTGSTFLFSQGGPAGHISVAWVTVEAC